MPTTGPGADPGTVVRIGKAAHITAAASGGPRYDATLTSDERRSLENGVWLCANCHDLVDRDVTSYPIGLLRQWKLEAEREARRGLLSGNPFVQRVLHLRDELAQILRRSRVWMGWVSAALVLLVGLVVLTIREQGEAADTAHETLATVTELHEARLVEIDDVRRKLQAALERLQRTEGAVTRIALQAARAGTEHPEIRELANELSRLVESFRTDFDVDALTVRDQERLAFAQAVRCNAEGLYDEALELVTEEIAAREERAAETARRAAEEQAKHAFDANMIRGDAFLGKQHYRKALECYRLAEKWSHDNLGLLWNLGFCLSELRKPRHALTYMTRVVQYYLVGQGERHDLAGLAISLSNRGATFDDLGRYDEALEDFGKASTILTRLVEDEGCPELALDLARSLNNRGTTFDDLGRYDEALDDHGKAIAILTRLVEDEGRPELAGDLARSFNNRGASFGDLGRYDEALKDYGKAIVIRTRLVEDEGRPELAGDLASSLSNRGTTFRGVGRYDEALDDHGKASTILTRLVEDEGRQIGAPARARSV